MQSVVSNINSMVKISRRRRRDGRAATAFGKCRPGRPIAPLPVSAWQRWQLRAQLRKDGILQHRNVALLAAVSYSDSTDDCVCVLHTASIAFTPTIHSRLSRANAAGRVAVCSCSRQARSLRCDNNDLPHLGGASVWKQVRKLHCH